jgi:hypothetical protein
MLEGTSEASCRDSAPIGVLSHISILPISVTERHVKKCCANVLTIIEASFNDPTQRDAIKDLIKQQFNRTLDTMREQAKSQ